MYKTPNNLLFRLPKLTKSDRENSIMWSPKARAKEKNIKSGKRSKRDGMSRRIRTLAFPFGWLWHFYVESGRIFYPVRSLVIILWSQFRSVVLVLSVEWELPKYPLLKIISMIWLYFYVIIFNREKRGKNYLFLDPVE